MSEVVKSLADLAHFQNWESSKLLYEWKFFYQLINQLKTQSIVVHLRVGWVWVLSYCENSRDCLKLCLNWLSMRQKSIFVLKAVFVTYFFLITCTKNVSVANFRKRTKDFWGILFLSFYRSKHFRFQKHVYIFFYVLIYFNVRHVDFSLNPLTFTSNRLTIDSTFWNSSVMYNYCVTKLLCKLHWN